MQTVLADNKGGITLGTKIIRKYGQKFAVSCDSKYIVLTPIKKNFNNSKNKNP
ncbi:hypothetical protein HYX07_02765 [Candidatus Woesearchaeota archaeon]|nr:hypothetical protein [Candidatus Woesearchaeota archaeon]